MHFGSLIDFYYLCCTVFVFGFLISLVSVAVGWLVWFGFFNRVVRSPANTLHSCNQHMPALGTLLHAEDS